MNGGDSISKDFEAFLKEHNIENTPQDIGPLKWAIQIIVAMTKSMLEVLKFEKSLWMEAVANVVYTLNRCPTRVLHYVTFEETWSGRRPLLCTHAHVWKHCICNDSRREAGQSQ